MMLDENDYSRIFSGIIFLIKLFFKYILIWDGIFLCIILWAAGSMFYAQISSIIIMIIAVCVIVLTYFLSKTKIGFWVLSVGFSLFWTLLFFGTPGKPDQDIAQLVISYIVSFAVLLGAHIYSNSSNSM